MSEHPSEDMMKVMRAAIETENKKGTLKGSFFYFFYRRYSRQGLLSVFQRSFVLCHK